MRRMVGVLTVLAMLCAVGPTPGAGARPVDIANEGRPWSRRRAGDFEQVFLHAARILGATGTDLEGRTPDELWYRPGASVSDGAGDGPAQSRPGSPVSAADRRVMARCGSASL